MRRNGESAAPTPLSWVRASATVLVLALSPMSTSHAQGSGGHVSLGSKLASMGREDGSGEAILANIIDPTLIGVGEGFLVLLDQIDSKVKAFSREGTFVSAIGRAGSGPGELEFPVALKVAGDSVVVLDRGRTRLVIFRLVDRSLRFLGEVPVPINATDFCVTEEGFVLSGFHQGHILHAVNRSGVLVSSFGSPFDRRPGASEVVDLGHVECGGGIDGILLASVHYPVLRRYDRDRSLTWESEIPHFSPIVVSMTDRGGVRMALPAGESTADAVISLAEVPTAVMVQFGRRESWMRGFEEISSVRSVFFDRQTGEILMVEDQLPRLEDVSRRFAVSQETLPFPRVHLWTRR